MSSGVLAVKPDVSVSQSVEKKETPKQLRAQMQDKPTVSEDHPAVSSNDRSGDQNNEQKSGEAPPERNNAAPKPAKADRDEQQVPCDANCPVDQQTTGQQIAAQKPREQKHVVQPQPKSQPRPQPAPAAPAKPAAKKSGHWETIVEKPAWDEPIYEMVTDYKTVGYYVYNYDGYREQVGSPTDHDHGKELALAGKPANYHVESVKEPIGSHRELVDTIHHEAVTRQVWVED